MNANLLSLNFSKTEFLLIGLKNQLAKIHNSSLDTSHFARNLNFIFGEHPTISDQITSLPKACCYHIHTFIDFAAFSLTSIRQLPVPLLYRLLILSISLLSFTPNLITVILFTILPKYQLSRLQQIQNSVARRPTVVKAPKSCHITPILRSLQWLRITERIEYEFLSLYLPNLYTFITSSLFNVFEVLALHPSLLLLGYRHHL